MTLFMCHLMKCNHVVGGVCLAIWVQVETICLQSPSCTACINTRVVMLCLTRPSAELGDEELNLSASLSCRPYRALLLWSLLSLVWQD